MLAGRRRDGSPDGATAGDVPLPAHMSLIRPGMQAEGGTSPGIGARTRRRVPPDPGALAAELPRAAASAA